MTAHRSPLGLALPVLATVVVVLASLVAVFLDGTDSTAPVESRPLLTGVVVDERGRAVPEAGVWAGKGRTTTDGRGRFTLEHEGATVVTVGAPEHLSRSVAVEPGHPARVVLTSDAQHTLSLRFGGDVMLGRRYYTGSGGTPALLRTSSGVSELAGILSGVRPLLEDADVTVVNLETALVKDPWTHVDGPRPRSVHPSKELVITSSTKMAKALKQSGIDIVSLSNNHTFDALDPGIKSTTSALDAAGVRHFGAGPTVEDAWKPAVVTVRGQKVAFVGCTTVDGHKHELSYVANDEHGGAAACDRAHLVSAVTQARGLAPMVAVSIHGGVEYRRSQTAEVRELAQAAHEAGARLVMGSHPHVVGGMVSAGGNVFVESLGNLAFDQELWSTFPGYLVRADIRADRIVTVDEDPIAIEGYRPRPVVGAVADSIARIASGWVAGGAVIEDGRARISPDPSPDPPQGPTQATVPIAKDEVRRLSRGWALAGGPALKETVRAGTDLLYGTGTFERVLVGAAAESGSLWSLSKYGVVSSDASCDTSGGRGLLLARSPLSTEAAVASPEHRAGVAQGQLVTVTMRMRRASAGSRLEVHWYKDWSGPSTKVSHVDLPTGVWNAGSCLPLRYDVVVPQGAVAAQVFVVLDPPGGGQTVRRLAVDDVMLVDWAPKGRSGRRYDVVTGLKATQVTFAADDPRARDGEPLAP